MLGRGWGWEDRGRGSVAGRRRSTVALRNLVLLGFRGETPLGEERGGGWLGVLQSGEAHLRVKLVHAPDVSLVSGNSLLRSKKLLLICYLSWDVLTNLLRL